MAMRKRGRTSTNTSLDQTRYNDTYTVFYTNRKYSNYFGATN
jgi:hypothetical protein